MARLDSLIRFKKHGLDEKQKALGELNSLLAKLENDVMDLDKEREYEISISKNDLLLAMAIPQYLENNKKRKEKIQKAIKNVEEKIEKAMDEIRDAFAELKKYEIVEDRRKEAKAKAILKKETQEFDQIAIERFSRNKDNRDS